MSTLRMLVAQQLVMRGFLKGEDVEPWLDTEQLSNGFYAQVYPLGDRLVVKITEDKDDARAAVHVKRLQDRGGGHNLVRVHSVFSINGDWVIVNERCDQLPPDVQMAVDSIWGDDRYYFMTAPLTEVPRASNAQAIQADLKEAGVTQFSDWHGRNVMWRHERWNTAGGRVVLVDFGCSKSPELTEIAA